MILLMNAFDFPRLNGKLLELKEHPTLGQEEEEEGGVAPRSHGDPSPPCKASVYQLSAI